MRRFIIASPLMLAVLLAACSSSAGGTTATIAPSVAAPSQPAASVATAGSASPETSGGTAETYEVKVASGTVGGANASFLTGEDGKTLYTFTPDKTAAGKSVCNGDCATNWPPFTVDSKDQLKADSGVTGALDVIARDDGSKQVTYNGQPLYYFAADKKAGDTTGQGIGGKWFVAAP